MRSTLFFTHVQILLTFVVLILSQYAFAHQWYQWQGVESVRGTAVNLATYKEGDSSVLNLADGHRAFLKKTKASDFRLDVDIKAYGMVGIGFRAQDLLNYDYVFVRTDPRSAARAIQYIPVYNGSVAWHLYPHWQSPAEVAKGKTFHVTLRCEKNLCQIQLDNSDPFSFETDPKRTKSGFILLRSAFGEAHFKNFNLQPLGQPLISRPSKLKPKSLSNWRISEQVHLAAYAPLSSIRQALNKQTKSNNWQAVTADSYGVVNLAKYFKHPKNAVFAHTCVNSKINQQALLTFDYSHIITIFLNDAVIFSGRELDSNNFFRVYPGEESLKVALNRGTNELIFWVHGYNLEHNPTVMGRQQYDNWGFTANLEAQNIDACKKSD